MDPQQLIQRIEHEESLDDLAAPLRDAVHAALSDDRVGYALSGAWMGHAAHPLLTDVVIGTWTSAAVLDLLCGRAARPAARRLIGLGILAAIPTAATGAHDWADESTATRRAGLVHAAANTVGLGLQVASWRARGRGHHIRGALLSTVAMAAVGVGGYIGGHMSYALGAGVSRTAFDQPPGDWTATIADADLADEPVAADVDGTPVVLVRSGDTVLALADTCTHAGCSLAQAGEVHDGSIHCHCHGSRFSLADGTVESGPAATPQPTYDTRVVDGTIQVRPRA